MSSESGSGVLIIPAYMSDYARSLAMNLRAELGDRAPAVAVRERTHDCQPYAETGSCEHFRYVELQRHR